MIQVGCYVVKDVYMLKRCCNRFLLAGLMVIALGGGATAQELPLYPGLPMVLVEGVQYTLPTLRINLPGYEGSCGRYIPKPVADVQMSVFNASEVEPVTLKVTIEILGDSDPAASRPVYGRKDFVLTLNKQGVSAAEEEVPLREDMLFAAKWPKLRAIVTVASSRNEPITLWSQPVTVDTEAYQSYSSNTVLKFNGNNQIRVEEANGCRPPALPYSDGPAPWIRHSLPSPSSPRVQPLPKPVVAPQPAPARPLLVQPLPKPVVIPRISPVNPVPLRQAR